MNLAPLPTLKINGAVVCALRVVPVETLKHAKQHLPHQKTNGSRVQGCGGNITLHKTQHIAGAKRDHA